MADIRINSLPSTATSFNTDDYIAIDGASGGTRRMLAANPPFSDVTLGTSGPSVKSTLSARAPRQGLMFDGTSAGATFSVTSPGTGDFTASAWVNTNGFVASIFGMSNGVLDFPSATEMRYYHGPTTTSYTVTIPALTVGKWFFATWSRSSGTISCYINGVLQGSVPANVSLTNFNYLGSINSFNKLNGLLSGCLIYNRALSASEVVALYEAGAPAGSDYNNASNTALNTVAWSNEVAALSGFSATTTSFSCTATNNGGVASIRPAMKMRPQAKYRITYTYNDSVPLYVVDGAGFSLLLSTGTAVTREFTYTGTGGFRTALYPAGSGSVSVTDISFIALGLLLAPDAAQAGGGLVWYDTSGNAANITLPASGVSWNVPTSSKSATGWTFAGNLSTGTGTNGFGDASVTPSTAAWSAGTTAFGKNGTNKVVIGYLGSLTNGATIASNNSNFSGYAGMTYAATQHNFCINETEYGRFAPSGNFLLGTTTDGGQKLQVSGDAAFAGDRVINRKDQNAVTRLQVRNDTSGTSGQAQIAATVGDFTTYTALGQLSAGFTSSGLYQANSGYLVGSNALYIFTASSSSLVLGTNNTTALTLDSSQRVITASTLNVGSGTNDAQFINVFTNKVQNTSGPVTINLPADSSGVVTLYSSQGGIGKSMWQIPYINDGGTVQLGTAVKTIKTADPVSSAVAATGAITVSVVAANTYCFWGINCVKP